MRVTKKRRGTATDVDGRERRREEREKRGKRETAREAAGRTEKRWRQSRGNEVESDVSYE